MKILTLFISLLCFISVNAEERSEERDVIIQKIMEAQGLIETFEQQLKIGKEHSHEQGRSMLNQMFNLIDPPPEFIERFEKAFKAFMKEVETPWGADEIVAVWSQYYGQHLTDDELTTLLKFYSSPLAQKEVMASRQAMMSFSQHFMQAGKPIAEKAIANFIADLQLISKECNCKR